MKTSCARIVLLGALLSSALHAADPLIFENAEQEQRYADLTQELRCLVCQNQNLADSDAPLAQDLRAEIHKMLLAGRNDEEIKTFLVERYGDFVLYRPPVKPNTVALWFFPALLLSVGAVIVLFVVRRQKRQPADEETEREE